MIEVKKVEAIDRLMSEGTNSLFWKSIVEEIQRKIALESNLKVVTVENLENKKGAIRAFEIVLNIPEILKEREKGE